MSLGLTQMINESKCGGNRPRCEAHGNQNHTEPRPEKEPPPKPLTGALGGPFPLPRCQRRGNLRRGRGRRVNSRSGCHPALVPPTVGRQWQPQPL